MSKFNVKLFTSDPSVFENKTLEADTAGTDGFGNLGFSDENGHVLNLYKANVWHSVEEVKV